MTNVEIAAQIQARMNALAAQTRGVADEVGALAAQITDPPAAEPSPDPEPGPSPKPEPVVTTYTVQPGDTLSRVAALHFVTVADLVAWNDIPDPDRIRVGDVLAVTAPAAEPQPEPGPTPEPEPAPQPEPDPAPSPASLTSLTATVDGEYVVLDWDGPDTIHLTAEDFDAAGELIGETDQGLVTGSPQRRGPMGRRDGAGYRVSARPVYGTGAEGELHQFPLATFPVESEPAPTPAGGRAFRVVVLGPFGPLRHTDHLLNPPAGPLDTV